jgi:hypothetical protein
VRELSLDRSAQETADELVQLALDAGSDDNITLQVLRLENRDGVVRQYPPPPIAMATVPASFQRGATVPSAAFNDLRQRSPLAAPVANIKSGKKKPLLYVATSAACFLLAVAMVFFVGHGHWPLHFGKHSNINPANSTGNAVVGGSHPPNTTPANDRGEHPLQKVGPPHAPLPASKPQESQPLQNTCDPAKGPCQAATGKPQTPCLDDAEVCNGNGDGQTDIHREIQAGPDGAKVDLHVKDGAPDAVKDAAKAKPKKTRKKTPAALPNETE